MSGVVGLRSPLLLAALPTLAWRFLGDVPFYWTWTWHYDAVLMPLAVAAMLDALGPAPQAAGEDGEPVPEPARRAWRRRTALALGAATLAVVLAAPGQPVLRLLDAETWRPSARADAAREVLATVPDGAVVSSDISLLAYLVPTTTAQWSGTPDNPPPDYYVVDRRSGTWGGNPPEDAARHAEDRHPGAGDELVLDRDGYLVARRAGGPASAQQPRRPLVADRRGGHRPGERPQGVPRRPPELPPLQQQDGLQGGGGEGGEPAAEAGDGDGVDGGVGRPGGQRTPAHAREERAGEVDRGGPPRDPHRPTVGHGGVDGVPQGRTQPTGQRHEHAQAHARTRLPSSTPAAQAASPATTVTRP